MSGVADAGALHHVGVVVPSLSAAIPFYRDVLGYAIGPQHDVNDQRVKVVFVTRGDSRVELLEPTDSESGVARFLADRGRASMHHLCFEVDDLARTLERLKSEGVECIDRAPRRGVDGLVAFIHPRASGGVLVELLERSR
ncbi:MAG TPA: methylmalonyl-CoA epimerase [Candidatus Limnocylindrales bacterium]|nr:methylmalonyl-CoA epimerase [Candidatus Limnocylindrales bacterium]